VGHVLCHTWFALSYAGDVSIPASSAVTLRGLPRDVEPLHPRAAPRACMEGCPGTRAAEGGGAAQPRLPSEARELLPRGGGQGGGRPRPSAFFSGLRGRGGAFTVSEQRAARCIAAAGVTAPTRMHGRLPWQQLPGTSSGSGGKAASPHPRSRLTQLPLCSTRQKGSQSVSFYRSRAQ
jgi:hypothetical protein